MKEALYEADQYFPAYPFSTWFIAASSASDYIGFIAVLSTTKNELPAGTKINGLSAAGLTGPQAVEVLRESLPEI